MNSLEESLFLACRNGNLHLVEQLMKNPEVDVNKTDACGDTPFMVACSWARISVVELFLKDPRVDINQVDAFGRTALHLFARNSDFFGMATFLAGARVVVNTKARTTRHGQITAAEYAKKHKDTDFVDLIEAYEVNPAGTTRWLRSALKYDGQSPLWLIFS